MIRTNAESSGGECRRKSPGRRRRDRRAVSRGHRFPSCEKRCIRRSADHVSSGLDRGEAHGFRSNATRRFWFSDLHAGTRNRLRHRRLGDRGNRSDTRQSCSWLIWRMAKRWMNWFRKRVTNSVLEYRLLWNFLASGRPMNLARLLGPPAPHIRRQDRSIAALSRDRQPNLP